MLSAFYCTVRTYCPKGLPKGTLKGSPQSALLTARRAIT